MCTVIITFWLKLTIDKERISENALLEIRKKGWLEDESKQEFFFFQRTVVYSRGEEEAEEQTKSLNSWENKIP